MGVSVAQERKYFCRSSFHSERMSHPEKPQQNSADTLFLNFCVFYYPLEFVAVCACSTMCSWLGADADPRMPPVGYYIFTSTPSLNI